MTADAINVTGYTYWTGCGILNPDTDLLVFTDSTVTGVKELCERNSTKWSRAGLVKQDAVPLTFWV